VQVLGAYHYHADTVLIMKQLGIGPVADQTVEIYHTHAVHTTIVVIWMNLSGCKAAFFNCISQCTEMTDCNAEHS
jgi:hypothetical protein